MSEPEAFGVNPVKDFHLYFSSLLIAYLVSLKMENSEDIAKSPRCTRKIFVCNCMQFFGPNCFPVATYLRLKKKCFNSSLIQVFSFLSFFNGPISLMQTPKEKERLSQKIEIHETRNLFASFKFWTQLPSTFAHAYIL